MRHSKLVILSLAALTAVVTSPAVAVRSWNRPPSPPSPGATPRDLAADYVHIMDLRNPSNLVSVQWLPPLAMSVKPGEKAMFEEFVIIAVSHVSFAPDSDKLTTHQDEVPSTLDADNKVLTPVLAQDQPEPLRKFLDYKRGLVRDAKVPDDVGPPPGRLRDLMLGYAHNLRFYAFRAGSVRECTKGRLTIAYAGENYIFDTPLPGCAARSGS